MPLLFVKSPRYIKSSVVPDGTLESVFARACARETRLVRGSTGNRSPATNLLERIQMHREISLDNGLVLIARMASWNKAGAGGICSLCRLSIQPRFVRSV